MVVLWLEISLHRAHKFWITLYFLDEVFSRVHNSSSGRLMLPQVTQSITKKLNEITDSPMNMIFLFAILVILNEKSKQLVLYNVYVNTCIGRSRKVRNNYRGPPTKTLMLCRQEWSESTKETRLMWVAPSRRICHATPYNRRHALYMPCPMCSKRATLYIRQAVHMFFPMIHVPPHE